MASLLAISGVRPLLLKKGSSTSFFYGQETVDSRTFLNGYSD